MPWSIGAFRIRCDNLATSELVRRHPDSALRARSATSDVDQRGSCQNVEKPSTLIVIPRPVASYMNVVPWLVGVMIQPMAW